MDVKLKRNPGFLLLALLVIASAIAAIFFGDDLQRLSGESEGALVFPQLRVERVRRVTLDSRGARVVLERVLRRPQAADGGAPGVVHDSVPRGDWYITSPRRIPADEAGVQALLLRLAHLSPLRELHEPELGALALEPPRWRVELTDDDGAVRSIALGVEVARGGVAALATRHRGRRSTFVVAPDVAAELPRTGWALREGRLTSLRVTEATALRIERGRERVSLVRAAEGGWAVDGVSPANERPVLALLAEIERLRGERFIVEGEGPHDLRALGLEPADVRVRIDVGESTLRIGLRRRGTTVIAANLSGGPVIEVPSSLLGALERPASAWSSRRALRFAIERVAVVRWSRRGALVLLAKGRDGQWSVLAPKPAPARPEAVRQLLEVLASLEMDSPRAEPAALARYGLAPASLEIALDDEAGRRLDALHLGRTQGRMRWARSPQWSKLFLVDAAKLAAVPIDPAQLTARP